MNDAAGGRIAAGKIESVRPDIDPKTGKVTVRTSFPNPDHRWRAGLYVGLAVEVGLKTRSTGAAERLPRRDSNLSLDERPNELEQKVDRLLDEKDIRSTDAQLLERLSELDRKLDRALNIRPGK